MNIFVLSWRDLKHSLAGGAEQVMHEHMKGWVSAGHSVTFFSSKVKNLPEEEVIDGIRVIRNGYQYLGVQVKAFFYYLNHNKEFDLIVDEFHGIPFFTPLYVKKPILAVLQEVAREVWFKNPFIFPINYIIGLIGYLSEPFILSLYKKIRFMVGSNSAKQDLIKFGIKEDNITVVPHGVILPSYNIKHKQSLPLRGKAYSYKVITFLGTLSQDKGIDDALKTFKILNTLDDYKFWVIGKAESEIDDKRLRIKVESMKLNKKIIFWGRVDDKKKFDLLSKSFVLINPSIREGWGLVNIEANAAGTPVVAYPSQGLVDSVKDQVSGVITKSKTPEDLANEIETLVRDRDRYKKLSDGAVRWANSFSWKKSSRLSRKLLISITNLYQKNH